MIYPFRRGLRWAKMLKVQQRSAEHCDMDTYHGILDTYHVVWCLCLFRICELACVEIQDILRC